MCQPHSFHSARTSKRIWLHCWHDVAVGPQNGQTEKCDVGQITAVAPLKKIEFLWAEHKAVVTASPQLLYALSTILFSVCSAAQWETERVE